MYSRSSFILSNAVFVVKRPIKAHHCDRKKVCTSGSTDPFTKLVHNGAFPKFEVMHFSQNTMKSIKIQ